ncbi:MAG: DUF3592 domain-containing protein [Chloroflexi bacterium]|nr:DUF3592 domain-containing protein [Chloroflexota bacterium]
MDGNLYCLGGVGVVFLLVSLLAATTAIKDWRRYRESENWAPAVAQIVSGNISAQRGSKSTSYVVNVRYAYSVLGQSYEGGQFSFGSEGTGYDTRKKAEKVIAQYPAGSQAAIYYDPNNPQQAVLERKYDSTGAILAAILGTLGAGMVIYSYVQLLALGN